MVSCVCLSSADVDPKSLWVVVGPPGVSLDGADQTLTGRKPCDVTYDSCCWSWSSLITACKACLSISGSPRSRKTKRMFSYDVQLPVQATVGLALNVLSFFFPTCGRRLFWKRHDWKGKLCSFSPSFAPECNVSFPTIPTRPRWQCITEQERLCLPLSWLLMRSTAVPRWTKVTDEPGWTTWQSGAGMDWMEKHQGSTQSVTLLPSLYDSEKYWVALVHFIHYYFSMVLLHVAAFLTSFLQGSQNPFLGVPFLLRLGCRTPLTSHRCYADFFPFIFKSDDSRHSQSVRVDLNPNTWLRNKTSMNNLLFLKVLNRKKKHYFWGNN